MESGEARFSRRNQCNRLHTHYISRVSPSTEHKTASRLKFKHRTASRLNFEHRTASRLKFEQASSLPDTIFVLARCMY